MEMFKRLFTQFSPLDYEQFSPLDCEQLSPIFFENVKLQITRLLSDHYVIFCASIDPMLNHERQNQMVLTESCYDFMTVIKDPASFAKQLGVDVRKQLNTLSTIVYHGPVIYLDEDKVDEFTNRSYKRFCDFESFPDFPPIAEHEIRLFVKEKNIRYSKNIGLLLALLHIYTLQII